MSVKSDERKLWNCLMRRTLAGEHPIAHYIAEDMGMHPKRLQYILEKWDDKGLWEYGVSARTGWFTPEALESLEDGKS